MREQPAANDAEARAAGSMAAVPHEAHIPYALSDEAEWWERFFESPDSIPLSYFPSTPETQRELDGIRRLLQPRPSDRILDACCGMGRHAVPLAAGGCRLVGVDRSHMMVGMATEAARQAGAACRFIQADAGRLPFPSGHFTKVLNLFNSFGYCETDEGNIRVLAETARCLQPGGTFLLETRNKLQQLVAVPYTRCERLPGGRRVRLRCYYDAARRRLNSEWTDAQDEDILHHFASIRLYDLDEITGMLNSVGLHVVTTYGEYDGAAFDRWHWKLVLLCHKSR
ncbi:MAG: class I SAM-dependent methyltransferase [Armatimonadota bacterium]